MSLTKEDLDNNARANVIYARKELKLTQKKFGEILQVKRPVIGSIEEYRTIPSLHLIYKLSLLIQVSIETLYLKRLDAGNTDN